MGLQGVVQEFIVQANYAVSIIMIFILVVTIWKRAWAVGFTSILGISFLAIFINRPTIIQEISAWLARLFGL